MAFRKRTRRALVEVCACLLMTDDFLRGGGECSATWCREHPRRTSGSCPRGSTACWAWSVRAPLSYVEAEYLGGVRAAGRAVWDRVSA